MRIHANDTLNIDTKKNENFQLGWAEAMQVIFSRRTFM